MSHYCRLCLSFPEKVVSAFVQVEGQSLSSLIQQFCGVQICKRNVLSKQLCHDCYKVIYEMFKLKEKSLASDERLKSDGEPQKDEMEIEENKQKQVPAFDIFTAIEEAQKEYEESFLENSEEEEDQLDEVPLKKRIKSSKATSSKTKAVEKEKPYSCTHCENSYDIKKDLFKHFNEFHDPARNVNRCHHCEQHFKFRWDLPKHLKIHEMDALASKKLEIGKKYQLRECSQCEEEFNDLSDLEEHWDEKHDKSLNPFSCVYCNDRFKSQELTKQHLLAEHESFTTDGKIVFLQLNRQAIFVNPTKLAWNTDKEKRNIKLVLRRLEKAKEQKNSPVAMSSNSKSSRSKKKKRSKTVQSNNTTERIPTFDKNAQQDYQESFANENADEDFDLSEQLLLMNHENFGNVSDEESENVGEFLQTVVKVENVEESPDENYESVFIG